MKKKIANSHIPRVKVFRKIKLQMANISRGKYIISQEIKGMKIQRTNTGSY
jgi:hypothetical protein